MLSYFSKQPNKDGACFLTSSKKRSVLKRKIPLFQRQPSLIYFLAVSKSGFSLNSETLYPGSQNSDVLI